MGRKKAQREGWQYFAENLVYLIRRSPRTAAFLPLRESLFRFLLDPDAGNQDATAIGTMITKRVSLLDYDRREMFRSLAYEELWTLIETRSDDALERYFFARLASRMINWSKYFYKKELRDRGMTGRKPSAEKPGIGRQRPEEGCGGTERSDSTHSPAIRWVGEAVLDQLPHWDEGLLQWLSDALDSDALYRAINSLPGPTQKAIKLRAEGLSYREIADHLGISHTAVSNRLTTARVRLSRNPAVQDLLRDRGRHRDLLDGRGPPKNRERKKS